MLHNEIYQIFIGELDAMKEYQAWEGMQKGCTFLQLHIYVTTTYFIHYLGLILMVAFYSHHTSQKGSENLEFFILCDRSTCS